MPELRRCPARTIARAVRRPRRARRRPSARAELPAPALLDRDRLGEVARLVDVRAAGDRHVVGEQLERDDREDRAQRLVGVGDPADVVGEALDLRIALGRDRDDPRVAGPALHDVADQLVVDRRAGRDRRRAGTPRRAARSGRASARRRRSPRRGRS